jgi:trigger factor
VKVELKETDKLKRELNVAVDSGEVKSAMEQKFNELRRTVHLKGFRKGKAPLDMIRNLYGDQVKVDVADDLIKSTYPRAIQEKTLKVATPPTITSIDFTDEGGFAYTASVEVFPEIDRVDFEGLEAETIDTTPTDQEVEEISKQYIRRFSEQRSVERPVQDKDIVIVDLEKLFDSKGALPGSKFPGSEIDLSYAMTVKEFKDQLPGMNIGDSKEITVKYDEDYPDPKFADAEIRYRATVKEVKERLTSEFDDAFAKMTGKAETALELKMKIREDVKKEKDENLKRIQKRQVIRQLVKKNDVPIPDGLIEEYLDSVVDDLKKQAPEMSEEEVRMKYRPVGLNSMQWDMLWRKLADQEKIEDFAEANNLTMEQAQDTLRRSGKTGTLRESLLEGKVLDFLIDRAKKVPAREETETDVEEQML